MLSIIYAQCGAFYRADGPEEMRCVGETDFVHGVAAMSRAGLYGDVRLCTGIFSTVDLRSGEAAEPVVEAQLAASENFRGIRSAFPSDCNKHQAVFEQVRVACKNGGSIRNHASHWQQWQRSEREA